MTNPVLKTIARDVYAWIGAKGDSNSAAIRTSNGLVAIDAQQTPELGRMFRQAVELAAGECVTRLIDTHAHLDHTAGNCVFSDVDIVAQERTIEIFRTVLGPSMKNHWLIGDYEKKLKLFFGLNIDELVPPGSALEPWFKTRMSGPAYDRIDLVGPTETFSSEMTLDMPDDILHAHYWGPAHCDGDVILHLPRHKVAILGDLLFVGRFPWLGDCDLDGWIARLDRVLSLDLTTVVPGHGDVSTLKEVAEFRNLLTALRDPVRNAVRKGWSEEATLDTVALPEYADMPRYREWLKPNISSAYRYFKFGR